jgi:hypothetical protein
MSMPEAVRAELLRLFIAHLNRLALQMIAQPVNVLAPLTQKGVVKWERNHHS